jgi:hypothetical protein
MEKHMPKKRVFFSFLGEDSNRVQGLRLLALTPNYDLEFYDESVRVPFNSQNAEYIKSKIREKISRTTVTVCLISEETGNSSWVNWEIEESIKKGNKIIAMALKGVDRAVLPPSIKRLSLPFHAWNPSALNDLITQD